jgi:rRNA processing protein Gar1
VFLKIGKIVSSVGDEIVASMFLEKKPLDVKTAKSFYNRQVYLEDSRKGRSIGRIKNVIGRTEEPYLIISQGREKQSPDKLSGKIIYS